MQAASNNHGAAESDQDAVDGGGNAPQSHLRLGGQNDRSPVNRDRTSIDEFALSEFVVLARLIGDTTYDTTDY